MEKQAEAETRWGKKRIHRISMGRSLSACSQSESTLVRELMADLGVLKEGSWEERFLCFSPQERLFIHGRWQEGIEPDVGATAQDRSEFKRFHDLAVEFELRDSSQSAELERSHRGST